MESGRGFNLLRFTFYCADSHSRFSLPLMVLKFTTSLLSPPVHCQTEASQPSATWYTYLSASFPLKPWQREPFHNRLSLSSGFPLLITPPWRSQIFAVSSPPFPKGMKLSWWIIPKSFSWWFPSFQSLQGWLFLHYSPMISPCCGQNGFYISWASCLCSEYLKTGWWI